MSLESFLEENGFEKLEKIAHGHSSEVFSAVHKASGKKFALKVEKKDSQRFKMLEREVANLLLANSAGIGPKVFAFDPEEKIIVMEFIEGKTFKQFVEENPKEKQLCSLLKQLFKQAKKLDKIGLDHGQLAGKGKNILVRKLGAGKLEPVIVDFEKGSQCRKCHNSSQLAGFLLENPRNFFTRTVKETLGEKKAKEVLVCAEK